MDDNVYNTPQTGMEHGSPGSSPSDGFDFGDALSEGFEAFKENIGLGIGLTILLILVVLLATCTVVGYFFLVPHLMVGFSFMGLYMVQKRLEVGTIFIGFSSYGGILALFMVNFVVSSLFSIPLYTVAFKAMGDLSAKGPQEIYMAYALAAAQAGILYKAIGWVGTFITIYISIRMFMYAPYLIERKMSIGDAARSSLAITAPIQLPLLGLMLLSGLIAIAGSILCGIGFFVTIPLAAAMIGAAMNQLLGDETPKPA